MTRSQVRSAVRWESVIIALLGTALGLVLGLFFGWALVTALESEGFTRFRADPSQLVIVVLLAAIVGIVAAWFARRAAKLDILRAPSPRNSRDQENRTRTEASLSTMVPASSAWYFVIAARERFVGRREDPDREQPRVLRVSDRDRGDRDAGRHLHDREQRVEPVELCSGTGTPITGNGVSDAVMPGRCAAPPAPAMTTLRPRSAAPLA